MISGKSGGETRFRGPGFRSCTQMARETWATRTGFILAAVGSAVGLGNIWRFPFITGQYGGSSFLITYLAFVALIGFPAILVEFVIGRRTDRNPVGALRELGSGRGRTPAGCSSSPASSSCRTTASSRAGSSGTPSSASPRDSRSPIRPRRTRCSGRSRPASTRFCSTPCSCCSSSASSPPASGAASS